MSVPMPGLGALRLLAVLLSAVALPSASFAQEEEGSEAEEIEDLFTIKGKVQKPEIVVVIRRDNLDRGFTLDLRESFLDRIPAALREPPF